MTYPHIPQSSDYESDDGEHSQWRADSPVPLLKVIGHEATTADLEGPLTAPSGRKDSLSLTINELLGSNADDNHSSAQQERSDSTAVTVSSETPDHSPGTPAEFITKVIHESPFSEHIPTIEEPVAQPVEPTVVDQRPPASPEALPLPYLSPPHSPPIASKEQYAFRSAVPSQNDVTEAAGSSSSESNANEKTAPDVQLELAPEPETLAVPSSPGTVELVSPVESEVFVYPDSSPPQLVPVTMEEPESPEDEVFRYPAAETVAPAPAEPVGPIAPAPAPRRTYHDRPPEVEDTSSRDPVPLIDLTALISVFLIPLFAAIDTASRQICFPHRRFSVPYQYLSRSLLSSLIVRLPVDHPLRRAVVVMTPIVNHFAPVRRILQHQ